MWLIVSFLWPYNLHLVFCCDIYVTPFRVFHTTLSRWFLTGVWVIASLLKSPGLFSVFSRISIMLLFGWSPLVFLFPSPPAFVPTLWWLHQEHQLQLVSPSLSCSILFSVAKQGPGTYSSFLFLLLLSFTPLEFFTSVLADAFSLEFEWHKSPQVSRTRLRILAVLSNAVVWMVSTRPPTSKSSRPFNNPLVIEPKAPITIGTIVTFMFHSVFNSLARSRYLSFFSLSFRFILWSAGTAKSTILQILFFLLIIIRSGIIIIIMINIIITIINSSCIRMSIISVVVFGSPLSALEHSL